jgi:hypothetical protein
MGLVWGVAAVVYGLAAQAAPKNAAPAASGAAGGAAVAPSNGAAGAPSAAPTPSAAPGAPESGAPAVPADGTAPAAPDAAPAPSAPSAAEREAQEEEEEEEAREAARRKRKRRRQRALDADEAEDDDAAPVAPVEPRPEHWRLIGPHVLIGAERLTNVLTWTHTRNVSLEGSSFGPNNIDLERAGTDVSFLGSGGVSANVFGIPRLAIDGMFANGFTLGGSLSYMVTSGEHEYVEFNGSSNSGTTKSKVQDPASSVFILAPRLGVMIPASPFVAVWLRGGISRISISTEQQLFDIDTGAALTSTVTNTDTLVNLTLDPQLVITPVPRVGITFGALLDIGVGGTSETSVSSTVHDIKESAYGVTGGLVAIF